jgi:hypothetical protein
VPEGFTNTILLGSLLVPLGFTGQPPRKEDDASVPRLGSLPLARRDVERLHQILGLQRRLRDPAANPRGQRALAHRSMFREALSWMEIHGQTPDVVAHWRAVAAEEAPPAAPGEDSAIVQPTFRRRRRRRRRPRPAPTS